MNTREATEIRRMNIQTDLEKSESPSERNEKGQFATPATLALDILRHAGEITGHFPKIRFLDPALGTGAFYSALLGVIPGERIESAYGYEIDKRYASAAQSLWSRTGLRVRNRDFTTAAPPEEAGKFNLLICNPPYVRHHHLSSSQKITMGDELKSTGVMKLNRLSGLYGYFLGLSHKWMSDGAVAGWLIPSEFMDVNYGKGIRDYLTNHVTLHRIHRFDPEQSQFENALVSSAVVWFTNYRPPRGHSVQMTYGGTLDQPEQSKAVPIGILRRQGKWTRYPGEDFDTPNRQATLSDFFQIKRGIATGDNSFFVVTAPDAVEKGLPAWALKPLLPGPKNLNTAEVMRDQDGMPDIDKKLYLLDSDLHEDNIAQLSPELATYLQYGHAKGVPNRYLCARRDPWYLQEQRPPAPFMCTYLGRQRVNGDPPFRFILNHSDATALNVYLMMYPKEPLSMRLHENDDLTRAVWGALTAINPHDMIREGRVYGGGLRKLEPKELANVPATSLCELLAE